MRYEQKELVRVSFSELAHDPDTIAALFYARLFELDPDLRVLFHSGMKQQGQKFMEMLHTIVDSIERLDEIVTVVWQSGKRHGGYGVRPKDYATVRTALFETFALYLGDRFPPETAQAWAEVYDILETTMQCAAQEGPIPR